MVVSDDPVVLMHATLPWRETPGTVAGRIGRALPSSLLPRIQPLLDARSAGSIAHAFGWFSMPTMFGAPVQPERLLEGARARSVVPGRDTSGRRRPRCGRAPDARARRADRPSGAGSFRHDRLDRHARAKRGLSLSRRRHGKLFRLAVRLEQRLARLRAQEARFRLLLVGKAALAPPLTLKQLGGHAPTAGDTSGALF